AAVAQVGNSKIQDLDNALAGQHDVGRLEITVDHTPLVSKTHSAANLLGMRQQLRKTWKFAVLHQLRQGYAIHKLHAQIDEALFQDNVINSDDVWMVETAGGLGFQHQAFSQTVAVLAAVVHRDGLERYSTANQPVLRLGHHSHG